MTVAAACSLKLATSSIDFDNDLLDPATDLDLIQSYIMYLLDGNLYNT